MTNPSPAETATHTRSTPDRRLMDQIKSQANNPSQAREAELLTRQDIHDRQSDRTLKRSYANGFKLILIGQLLIMNAVFIAVGLGWLNFEGHVLELYLGGTLAEVFGIVIVITKNLFPIKPGPGK